ncbi:heat-inducible transcription repressor HrcA [Chitiniphilus shinanonensis]|uniref:Heat-inducible transcription repressor HrcA n=1 Tax=Chitiniphilus shinanonensis TaxID=553088 RepID=F8WSX6_9NEIS|nr:heat-inducible transcriptional repressor HrcA [Chitiniphilus shinanonensis]BAK53958.1 heat-inducible transcription repressor HrcA [Chitiniphilus shinanonensis]GLS04694.1 heat-inducible transcription repressor HrcA [Chitiniphilus shinanonensis]
MLSERAQILLRTLVERYIADGQPVGSKALTHYSGLDVSSATIRNVMADLEELGFVASPHTSAGRIPTARGYRFFVNHFLAVTPPERLSTDDILRAHPGSLLSDNPQRAVMSASQLLSQLTNFAGVVLAPKRQDVRLKQVEFLKLSDKRVLLILVTTDGDVQNRILHTETDLDPAQLLEASNFLNAHCAGRTLGSLRGTVEAEMHQLRGELVGLLNAALAQSTGDQGETVLISGEHHLLGSAELAANMNRLKQLFELFERKAALLQLLESGCAADGVQIFIGGESGLAPLDECSVITAPYHVDGQVVGTLGVIGPTRMAYERVIPIVDVTARLLSNALSLS